MELKLKTSYAMTENNVEEYIVSDGLDIEKVKNYISSLISQGFVFDSARITSSSDKDNNNGSYGDSDYDDLDEFMSIVNSKWLAKEPGACVTIKGTSKTGGFKTTQFFMDTNEIAFYTPTEKGFENDPRQK